MSGRLALVALLLVACTGSGTTSGPSVPVVDGTPTAPAAVYACPADFGPTYALFFDYPDGDRLLVLVSGSGCRFATNGQLSAHTDPKLLRTLRSLAHR
ncbi:MAG TPA: hypothetical protein VI364_08110 [Actinomycetota bacterium]